MKGKDETVPVTKHHANKTQRYCATHSFPQHQIESALKFNGYMAGRIPQPHFGHGDKVAAQLLALPLHI